MIDLTRIPTNNGRLFFGDNGGVPNLTIGGLKKYQDLANADEANFWSINTVSCSQDRAEELPPNALTKFQKNIGYQTAVDTLVPDVYSYLSEIATDPYLSYLYGRIGVMEKVHSMSYSAGLVQAFGAKSTEFLNIIYTDPKIKDRITSELDVAIRFRKAVQSGWTETEENAKLLLELLVRIFFLEGVKFPFSFLTTWTINRAYDNKIQGFSLTLLEIAKDEMQTHTTTGAAVINDLRLDPLFGPIIKSDWFTSLVDSVSIEVQEKEIDWSKYLLEDGEIQGFNEAICEHFIKYWIDRRRRQLKCEPFHNLEKNDIEKWFDSYRNINGKAVALQEQDSAAYQKGTLINDLYKFKQGFGYAN